VKVKVSAFVAIGLVCLAACGSDRTPFVDSPSIVTVVGAPAERGSLGSGTDVWEVAVCAVPPDAMSDEFAPDTVRLDRSPADIAELLGPVSDYFDRWSQGVYVPTFVPGAAVSIDSSQGSDDCVASAIAASNETANGVIVVADAPLTPDGPGGWGRVGEACEQPCPVAASGRAVFVGAADFLPDWGDAPPLDLIEHELGHAIGWAHSSTLEGSGAGHDTYDSPYDVMSASDAPRSTNAERRHAPGALAVNMLASGWLHDDEVLEIAWVGRPVGEWTDAVRVASTDSLRDGDLARLMVLDLGGGRFITIELLADRGDNDHLTSPGVIVHELATDGSSWNERPLTILRGDSGRLITTDGVTSVFSDSLLSVKVGAIIELEDGRIVADVRVRRDEPAQIRKN
jgi:hypothetical protein